MFSSIRTSEANKLRVTELTSKLQLGAENTIARIALGHSLAQNKNLNLKDILDSKGKEYSKKVLFGDQLDFYTGLICQKYDLYKTNKEIPRYLKLHIDNGLELLHEEIKFNPNQLGIDFLLRIIEAGLIDITKPSSHERKGKRAKKAVA